MGSKKDEPSKFEWEEGDLLLLGEESEESKVEDSQDDEEEGS
ncbi:hypothetical protein ACKW0K_002877 [Listeria monocytogenes]|nr:hypothetical protein [Listeria monocytogenes]